MFRNFLLKTELKLTNKIITLTNYTKDQLGLTLNKENICYSVIPHGPFVYPNKSKNKKNDKRNFLFFGRILPYKGLKNLLIAFQKIEEKNKNVKLKIVGSGSLSQYKKIIENINNIEIINEWVLDENVGFIFDVY